MEEIIIGAICIIFAVISNFYLTRAWMRLCRFNNFLVRDMNKYIKPLASLSGGVPLMMSFITSVLLYIFFKVFILHTETSLIAILGLLLTVMLAGFVGFLDDFVIRKGVESIGLKRWQKPLLTLIFALPLAALNSGVSTITIPLIGQVSLGVIYPIIVIPIAIMIAVNLFNILAGFNGLEGGMSVIILSTLGLISFFGGNMYIALISFIAVGSLLSFLYFNWNPAKIFPGDSFTYAVGALIASIAILGNMEMATMILFIPYFLDGTLLVRAIKDRQIAIGAFGIPDKNNALKLPGKKLYDMTHVGMLLVSKIKKKVYERDVVLLLISFEILLSLICLALFL